MPRYADNWTLYPGGANQAAPIAFAIIIAVLGTLLFYQSLIRFRWRHFGSAMTLASLVWIGGYVCRAISVHYYQNVNLYIAQYVLVIMGPPLYGAAEYFILGRLLSYLPYHAPIHPGRVISTFLFLSAIVESLTANGASNTAQSDHPEKRKIGLDCLEAALILQCFIEVFYFSMVLTVERRCRRAKLFPRNVRIVCYTLYFTSSQLLVRCIVRTIEGFQDAKCTAGGLPCGYIATHEWVFYVFECANITLFVVVLAVLHPGHFLPRSTTVFLDPRDGITERVGPGYHNADKRPTWQTIVDPFNLRGVTTGKGMSVEKFWEQPDQYPPVDAGCELVPLNRSSEGKNRSSEGKNRSSERKNRLSEETPTRTL